MTGKNEPVSSKVILVTETVKRDGEAIKIEKKKAEEGIRRVDAQPLAVGHTSFDVNYYNRVIGTDPVHILAAEDTETSAYTHARKACGVVSGQKGKKPGPISFRTNFTVETLDAVSRSAIAEKMKAAEAAALKAKGMPPAPTRSESVKQFLEQEKDKKKAAIEKVIKRTQEALENAIDDNIKASLKAKIAFLEKYAARTKASTAVLTGDGNVVTSHASEGAIFKVVVKKYQKIQGDPSNVSYHIRRVEVLAAPNNRNYENPEIEAHPLGLKEDEQAIILTATSAAFFLGLSSEDAKQLLALDKKIVELDRQFAEEKQKLDQSFVEGNKKEDEALENELKGLKEGYAKKLAVLRAEVNAQKPSSILRIDKEEDYAAKNQEYQEEFAGIEKDMRDKLKAKREARYAEFNQRRDDAYNAVYAEKNKLCNADTLAAKIKTRAETVADNLSGKTRENVESAFVEALHSAMDNAVMSAAGKIVIGRESIEQQILSGQDLGFATIFSQAPDEAETIAVEKVVMSSVTSADYDPAFVPVSSATGQPLVEAADLPTHVIAADEQDEVYARYHAYAIQQKLNAPVSPVTSQNGTISGLEVKAEVKKDEAQAVKTLSNKEIDEALAKAVEIKKDDFGTRVAKPIQKLWQHAKELEEDNKSLLADLRAVSAAKRDKDTEKLYRENLKKILANRQAVIELLAITEDLRKDLGNSSSLSTDDLIQESVQFTQFYVQAETKATVAAKDAAAKAAAAQEFAAQAVGTKNTTAQAAKTKTELAQSKIIALFETRMRNYVRLAEKIDEVDKRCEVHLKIPRHNAVISDERKLGIGDRIILGLREVLESIGNFCNNILGLRYTKSSRLFQDAKTGVQNQRIEMLAKAVGKGAMTNEKIEDLMDEERYSPAVPTPQGG